VVVGDNCASAYNSDDLPDLLATRHSDQIKYNWRYDDRRFLADEYKGILESISNPLSEGIAIHGTLSSRKLCMAKC